MDYLASVTDLKVFGCSIDFLQTATQTYLCENTEACATLLRIPLLSQT